MKSLLFLAHRIPYPPNKGDKVRSFNELKYLARRFRTYVGAFVDDEADFAHESELRAMCEDCHLVRLNPTHARVKSLTGLLTGEPLTLPYYRSRSMRQWVDNLLRTKSIDSILVFSAAMAQYVMRAKDICRVADLVDVDSDKWRQYAGTKPWPYSSVYKRESRTLLRYEREVAGEFDSTVLVSQPEAELFRRLAPDIAGKVFGINNGVDCDYFSPKGPYPVPYAAGEQVLVFTGAMDYWPNVEAATWFAHEVFPKIRAQCATARFYIVGARPTPEVQKLTELPEVTVTGSVPDIRPYIAHATLAVAPLRLARGIQNKVLEAMAMAKTVIASPQAAEGIQAAPGSEWLIAGDAQSFVQHAVQFLTGDNRASVGAAARARVLAGYSWESNLRQFEQLLAGVTRRVGTSHRDAGQVIGAASMDLRK